MLISIYWVRYQGKFRLHRHIQLSLGLVLLVAVSIFELEQRLIPWTQRAHPSPYFDPDQKWNCPVGVSLLIHLFFAVPTALLWVFVIVQALRNFDRDPRPNSYSGAHRFWARCAAVGMCMTAVTGWVFYYLAYVAV